MTATETLATRFADAWLDLRDRLAAADTNLAAIGRRLAEDNPERARLNHKRDGIDHARTAWATLANRVLTGDLDTAGAWRTFTDQMRGSFDATCHSGYNQGIHLALTYQRDYGPDIDAPVIANPFA